MLYHVNTARVAVLPDASLVPYMLSSALRGFTSVDPAVDDLRMLGLISELSQAFAECQQLGHWLNKRTTLCDVWQEYIFRTLEVRLIQWRRNTAMFRLCNWKNMISGHCSLADHPMCSCCTPSLNKFIVVLTRACECGGSERKAERSGIWRFMERERSGERTELAAQISLNGDATQPTQCCTKCKVCFTQCQK